MHIHPSQLRHALSLYLGQELTPEAAAHVEAVALVNTMPMPEIPQGCGLVNDQHQRYFDHVNSGCEGNYDPSSARVIANVGPGGDIKGVVLFNKPSQHSIEMAVSSDGSGHWLSKSLLKAAFRYPFVQLGKCRVTAVIRASNVAALRLDEGLGFRHEGLLFDFFGPGKACVVMGMLREQCRWIGKDEK